jgi:hypothetical protein
LILVAAAGALLSLSALAATSVDAARGGKGGGQTGGGTASITLNQTNPHLGDWVTFATNGGSRIAVACYQGGLGNMVYSADQATGTAFLLGGTNSLWRSLGGDVLCYAWLYSRSLSNGFLAATSFVAGSAR